MTSRAALDAMSASEAVFEMGCVFDVLSFTGAAARRSGCFSIGDLAAFFVCGGGGVGK